MTSKWDIAANLRRHLEASGMRGKDLARELAVSPQAVSAWLTGRNSLDIELVPRICELLGISIDELFGRDSPADPLRAADRDERVLLSSYRSLNGDGRAYLLMQAELAQLKASWRLDME